MALVSTPRERYLGGFYAQEEELYDAVYHGRRVRYIIVLDSYADAVAWRRLMAGDHSFITPLSQAAGEAANRLRDAIAVAEAQAEAAEGAASATNVDRGAPEEAVEPAPEGDPLGEACGHIHALLVRSPSYTDYDEHFVAIEKCAYCEADLDEGRHAADCAWQAARRFLLEMALRLPDSVAN